MKRATALLLVLVAVAAAQAVPENPDGPTSIKESECYDCHRAGGTGEGPVMSEVVRLFMADAPTLEKGDSTALTFDVRNWWTAELSGITATLDIGEAPAFSFEAVKAPVVDSAGGELPAYSTTAYFQGTPRHVDIPIEVEVGGTDLEIILTPDNADTDLILSVWGPDSRPGQDPPLAGPIDNAPAGEPERVSFSDELLQGGTYTVRAVEEPEPFVIQAPDFGAVSVQVDWTLSFKFEAGSTTRTEGTNDVLDGQDDQTPQSVALAWPINVVRDIEQEQTVRVYLEVIAYYDHAPQFRASDEWWFWTDVVYHFTPQEDGSVHVQRVTPTGTRVTEFIVADQVVAVEKPDEGPDLTVEADAPLDVWAEVIGYTAGFLLIASLLTGGAFGNWSRRLQQWMLYRRARNRVAFHNVISYGLIVAAVAHMVLFLVEPKYPWSVGFFLGTVSMLGMLASGVTGAFQRAIVDRIGHEAWRWLHYLSFVLAFSGALGHIVLDGIHFAEFQTVVGWEDPVAPVLQEWIPTNNTAPADAGPA